MQKHVHGSSLGAKTNEKVNLADLYRHGEAILPMSTLKQSEDPARKETIEAIDASSEWSQGHKQRCLFGKRHADRRSLHARTVRLHEKPKCSARPLAPLTGLDACSPLSSIFDSSEPAFARAQSQNAGHTPG